MDRITLKHYQDRTAKAEAIVKKIDALLSYSEKVMQARGFQAFDTTNCSLFSLSAKHAKIETPRLVDKIAASMEILIAEEIALLEQELAEL
ncbi:hypothetical protein SAMN04487969_102465 [Paenibacillus algorifonticola]|uniref:Uncharacterized protein n=1 Tax=Paenibacillus algorifonticola TaxID=684063 RepID=A0A1I2AFX9_9BACL|nr:hypothetical protein [Paenibacillus algorifonticola]SFE42709.1 hypothetical protein SAMN04487969_102465 [Paenibacillus algorifonticola]